MKTIIKLNLMLLGILCMSLSHYTSDNFKFQELDFIDVKCIKVNNLITINSTKNQVIKAFGKPDSIKIFFNELIDEKPTYQYNYQNSYFDIYDSKVEKFAIKDIDYSILGFRPGMDLDKLKKRFSKSFTSKYIYDENYPNHYIVKIGLKHKKEMIDSYVLFKVNKKNILSIEYWEEY